VIATTYKVPFAFGTSTENPWAGRYPVALTVHGIHGFDRHQVDAFGARVLRFWSLAQVGGLTGTAMAPWLSRLNEPAVSVQGGIVHVEFAPSVLDERATHSLLCLLLGLHEEITIERAILSTTHSAPHRVPFDPRLDDPYPGLWPDLPFPFQIEDSESETRVLRAQFTADLNDDQIVTVQRQLLRWGAAVEEGVYGIAPVDPRSCGCLPVNPVEHYQGEIVWPIEKCRFHYAALRSLVAVCATIHHRLGSIKQLTID